MRRVAVLFMAAGLVLTGCSNDYTEVTEQAEEACWEKYWPTYAENIATGMIGQEDAEARLARLCIELGKEAVADAKAEK